MNITKTKIALAAAAAVVGTQFVIHHQMTQELRSESEALRTANIQLQNREIDPATNPRLIAEVESLRETAAEVLALRGEVAALGRENQALKGTVQNGAGTPAEPPDASTLNNPSARMRMAGDLVKEMKYEEALQHLLWCFDEGATADPSFVGVRLSFLLNQLADLAKTYPPASEALLQRRDAAEAKFKAGSNDGLLALDVVRLNDALNQPKKTTELYDQLPEGDSRRSVIVKFAYDAFLQSGRYEDIFTAITPEAFFGDRAQNFTAMLTRPELEQNETLQNSLLDHLIGDGGKAIETLAGVGQTQRAISLIDQVLQFDTSLETLDDLKRHARRAGNPEVLQYLENH